LAFGHAPVGRDERRWAAKLLSKDEAWRLRPEYGEAALEIEFVVHAS